MLKMDVGILPQKKAPTFQNTNGAPLDPTSGRSFPREREGKTKIIGMLGQKAEMLQSPTIIGN